MIIKSQVVLYMYHKLMNSKGITLDEIVSKFNISIRTFRRYISEINVFLYNNYLGTEVVYDTNSKIYSLVSLNEID